MRRGALIALAGVTVLATATLATLATGALVRSSVPDAAPSQSRSLAPSPSPTGEVRSAELAAAFLDGWVEGDGRVVRRDQGGDSVSEGQAYGMLAAVVAKDEKAFDRIWTWTRKNLQRPDRLLDWRWEDGAVVDAGPATDGDLDAARALVIAGDDFDRPDLTRDGTTLANAIADKLTVQTAAGRILLPGLWAAGREPYAYNPSYASPVAFDVLGKATGDRRWSELQAGSAEVAGRLLAKSGLPPDWAQVRADGTVDAMPGAQGTGGPVAYGYDAQRVALRYAESCTASDRAIAARLYAPLDRNRTVPAVVDLGGGTIAANSSPLAQLSRGAAAAASGRTEAAERDLASARRLAAETPTYYGAAWVAIGSAMIDGTALGGCGADRGSGS